MKISANTLFHFAKQKYIKKILTDGCFYPRYCFESLNSKDVHGNVAAIPMVCFCDIKISQILPHAKKYSKNCIGLKKDWGIDKQLNPVHYITSSSDYNNYFGNLIRHIQNNTELLHFNQTRKLVSSIEPIMKNYSSIMNSNTIHQMEIIIRSLESYEKEISDNKKGITENSFKMYCYQKSNEGKIWDRNNNDFKKKNGKDVKEKFYDEREWRFVPNIPNENEYHNDISNYAWKPKWYFDKNEKYSNEIFEKQNEALLIYPLKFNANDVKYLIVEKEKDISNFSKFIEKLSNYNEEEKYFLISNIMSLERVEEDF